MKKILTLICLVFSCISLFAEVSGTCGENLTWTLDDNGTLTISGEGEMNRYDYPSIISPWYNFRTQIKSVIIREGTTTISSDAFRGCSNLTSVEIPNNVTSIGDCAFYFCNNLKSIEIPNSVVSMGERIFENCSSLVTIKIPTNLKIIDGCSFQGCNSLTSIEIPNNVTNIYSYAFNSCSALTHIVIPASVTSIGECAFAQCKNIISIFVDSSNSNYDSRSNSNAIIETATNTLIAGCQNTIIPISVTCIGDYAFSGCQSLLSIEIPNNITIIGNYAFANCRNLNKLTSLATIPPHISNNAFYNVTTSNIPLYVPAESVEAYKVADVWKDFDIRAIGSEKSFTVQFIGFNGADLGSQEVEAGEAAIAPDPQTPEGYKFIGWDKDFSNVQSDMIVKARYGKIFIGHHGNTEYEFIIRDNCK